MSLNNEMDTEVRMGAPNRKYVGINCSKCGRWVGKDGFYDIGMDDSTGMVEIGYPLCKRCLDARGPTIYECECELKGIGTPTTNRDKYRVEYLKSRIEERRNKFEVVGPA